MEKRSTDVKPVKSTRSRPLWAGFIPKRFSCISLCTSTDVETVTYLIERGHDCSLLECQLKCIFFALKYPDPHFHTSYVTEHRVVLRSPKGMVCSGESHEQIVIFIANTSLN